MAAYSKLKAAGLPKLATKIFKMKSFKTPKISIKTPSFPKTKSYKDFNFAKFTKVKSYKPKKVALKKAIKKVKNVGY